MPNSNSSKPRGAVSNNEDSHLVSVWVPNTWVEKIQRAVKSRDTDRSKWIREAIREKAAREGAA